MIACVCKNTIYIDVKIFKPMSIFFSLFLYVQGGAIQMVVLLESHRDSRSVEIMYSVSARHSVRNATYTLQCGCIPTECWGLGGIVFSTERYIPNGMYTK